MVTWYQAKADTSQLIFIDLYSKLEPANRPIPGYLLYTDGLGDLFLLLGDGTFKKIDLS